MDVKITGRTGLLLMLCIAGVATTEEEDIQQRCSMSSASAASRRFAYALYNTASGLMGTKRNILVSPLAVGQSLSMISSGASGWSLRQILRALDQSDSEAAEDPECLLQAYYGRRFNSQFIFKDQEIRNRTATLRTATRLFGEQNCTFREDFVQQTGLYGTEMAVLRIRKSTRNSERRINGWVHDQTKGNVRQIFKPGTLLNDTLLVATCSLYFKGSWAMPFTNHTKGKFNLYNGKKRTVRYMTSQAPLRYVSSNILQSHVTEIPYASPDGSNADARLVLIMPYDNSSIREVDSRLNDSVIQELFRQEESHEVRIQIPKFKLIGAHKLKFFLKRMGIREVFHTNKATLFDAVVQENEKRPKRIYVSNTEHKSRFEIDETGTQGESFLAYNDAVGHQNVKTLSYNKAFIFVLYDKFTDSIIYFGRLSDPGRNVG